MQIAAGREGGDGGEEGRLKGGGELKGQEGMSKQREEDNGGGTWSHAAGATEEGPIGASIYSSKFLWYFHLICEGSNILCKQLLLITPLFPLLCSS